MRVKKSPRAITAIFPGSRTTNHLGPRRMRTWKFSLRGSPRIRPAAVRCPWRVIGRFLIVAMGRSERCRDCESDHRARSEKMPARAFWRSACESGRRTTQKGVRCTTRLEWISVFHRTRWNQSRGSDTNERGRRGVGSPVFRFSSPLLVAWRPANGRAWRELR